MYAGSRNRTLPSLAALAVVGGIAAGLVLGLRPGVVAAVQNALPAFDLTPERPPEPRRKPPPPTPKPAERRAAAPAAVRPTGVAAPKLALPLPAIVLAPPVPVPAATVAATGSADRSGTGNGTGVAGSGAGGGGSGGDGAGGDGGVAVEAEQIKGRLTPHDLRKGALAPGEQLSVGVRYTVDVGGRVEDCAVTRSSGDAEVDERVCRLLTERFRYRPARDRRGEPVASTVRETHSWARREE